MRISRDGEANDLDPQFTLGAPILPLPLHALLLLSRAGALAWSAPRAR